MIGEVVFWVTGFALAWVYLGYPTIVALMARIRPVRLEAQGAMPSVSVAIVVHNEAVNIAERIADVVAQDAAHRLITEIIVGSDGSTDATVTTVREIASANPRVALVDLGRVGTTATQEALFLAATGEVVVLTDAETRFEPRCVELLAATFRDPRVACATGRLEWRSPNPTATSDNEGLYWRYERAVRDAESRAGLLTAVTGAVLAVRRSSFRPVPPTTSMDHLLPLHARAAGMMVVYVPGAVATDRPISRVREQFRNRARTATRGITANLSMVLVLAPWRHPGAAAAIWSHKILRWGTPYLVAIWAGAGLVLALQGGAWYAAAPLVVALGLILAAAGDVIARAGRRPPRLLAFPRGFVIVCAAFAVAWVNVIRGRPIEAWHRAEWQARN